jgi:hypothetical protein
MNDKVKIENKSYIHTYIINLKSSVSCGRNSTLVTANLARTKSILSSGSSWDFNLSTLDQGARWELPGVELAGKTTSLTVSYRPSECVQMGFSEPKELLWNP